MHAVLHAATVVRFAVHPARVVQGRSVRPAPARTVALTHQPDPEAGAVVFGEQPAHKLLVLRVDRGQLRLPVHELAGALGVIPGGYPWWDGEARGAAASPAVRAARQGAVLVVGVQSGLESGSARSESG